MNHEFRIQDPSDPETIYLYEEIINQVLREGIELWIGIFAFATGQGISTVLLDDSDIRSYIEEEETQFLIGLNQVTDKEALNHLSNLSNKYSNFDVKAFETNSGLFHPKVSYFEFESGDATLIVGSGNLTVGGLRKNIEAYTVIEGSKEDVDIQDILGDFRKRHSEEIKQIDDELIDRFKDVNLTSASKQEYGYEDEVEKADKSKVFVGMVPKGGGRWSQIHYNTDIMKKFFGLSPKNVNEAPYRLFLREVKPNGELGDKEVRPVVYSEKNRNLKIEASAKKDRGYPPNGRPIIMIKREGTRSYSYMLLFPDEIGHDEAHEVLEKEEKIGKGLSRTIIAESNLKEHWNGCPLVNSSDEDS